MSLFYKSNLMENDNISLIPAENDLKKEEDVKKNVSNVDENKPGETPKSPAKNVNFPYKRIIQVSQYLIYVAIVLFTIYGPFRTSWSVVCISKLFFEPCNATDVISIDEMEQLKNEYTAALNGMYCVNSVITYNISTYANDFSSQKLENLTEASTTLNKRNEEQKEFRFICYKMYIEKGCEENILKKYLYFYKIYANLIHAYIVAATTLLFISFYYISKARKCELSEEEERECNRAYSKSRLIAHSHFGWIIANGVNLYFDSCTVKEYLGTYPI